MALHVLAGILVFLCTGFAYADRAPRFVRTLDKLELQEDLQPGEIIGVLSAEDPDGGSIFYLTEQQDALSVDLYAGNVTLRRQLDYETEPRLRIRFIAEDTELLRTNVDVTITVIDVNDNPSVFTEERYQTQIPEDAPPGTVVFSQLSVVDEDYQNIAQLEVKCNPQITFDAVLLRLYQESCRKFKLIRETASNRNWRGRLETQERLDFEAFQTYQYPAQIYDGKFTTIKSLEVIVVDVNDAPPYFTRARPSRVREGLLVGHYIDYVRAVDGDQVNPRPIRYSLISNPGGLFDLEPVSGNISNAQVLDRDQPSLSRGYVDLVVKAQELINQTTGLLGNDARTTATATVRISVENLNDNIPSFRQTSHRVTIREDIPNEAALPNLIMTVTDNDVGTASFFNIVLLNYTDRFAVFPGRGQGQSTASMKVIDTTKIDYEAGPTFYILQVEAREYQTTPRRTGMTLVYVTVLDVNDNSPTFARSYEETIPETADGTRVVEIKATDPDSGTMGTIGIRYSLVGNGAEKFHIDPLTGVVIVVSCPTPGVPNCIDYETKSRYELSAIARDEEGRGNSRSSQLIINIEDVNDNVPRFDLNEYVAYIREGETTTVNPLIVRATDADTVGGPISYGIQGAGSSFWLINHDTGNIVAREPIKNSDATHKADPGAQSNQGEIGGSFRFIAIASDIIHNQTADVTIYILLTNDNSPEFIPNSNYNTTIPESTRGGVYVITVVANDKDHTSQSTERLEYDIVTGSQGKFEINVTNGDIRTSPDAVFDFDQQNQYLLRVLARDGGNPQRTGTASVTINILDGNNKFPYFLPTIQRASIRENVPNNTFVLKVRARDPDFGAVLNYRFSEPKSAITPAGVQVAPNVYNFTHLFRIDPQTGDVYTDSLLNRDRASVVTYTAHVIDITANPRQTGTGTVMITILEYNDQSPYFEQAVYNITIDEEQPIGTFIMALAAKDDEDTIDEYRLISNPQNLFAIDSQTGALTVNRRIDYESIQHTRLDVIAYDSGFPRRSNTTVVHVYIRNINDNSPVFTQTTYEKQINEHPNNGDTLLSVSANDIDLEDYGIVYYQLDPNEERFTIDNKTGEIKIRNGTALDRETQSTVSFQVTAYDSPNFPLVRRSFTVPVYVILLDINDHRPRFSAAEYNATIVETIAVGTEILQVSANDGDIGLNAAIAFRKVPGSGDPAGRFSVFLITGHISVEKNLRGHHGVYVFNVSATDRDGAANGMTAFARVTINVLRAINSPPKWLLPPSDNFTIDVLESQYRGMLVYDVKAEDLDAGNNGVVDYFFYAENGYTSNTTEFCINPCTGVIVAEIVFDREEVDHYVLLLVARDRGDPYLETSRFVTIRILDVNDNVPMFSMASGQTISYNFQVSENAPVNYELGQVTATDRDLEAYSRIFYYIIAGNDNEVFRLEAATGKLFLSKQLDRERQATYSIDILATNNISDYTVIRNRRRRSIDPSIVTVNIVVTDVNDQAPVFQYPDKTSDTFYGCINQNSPYGQSILQVQATDADTGGPAGIVYNFTSAQDFDYFGIDSRTGMIFNQFLFTFGQTVHTARVSASDGVQAATANVAIFVTRSGSEVKLLIRQRPAEVRLFLTRLIRSLRNLPGNRLEYVCVSKVTDHVMADGTITGSWSDVYITGIWRRGTEFGFLTQSQLQEYLETQKASNKQPFDDLLITEIGSSSQSQSLLDRTAILAVLIIVILLVILAIILLILCCCCIRNSKQKKIAKLKNQPVYPVTVPELESQKNDYPIFEDEVDENMGPVPAPIMYSDEPEALYSVVKKPMRRRSDKETVVIGSDQEPVIVAELESETSNTVNAGMQATTTGASYGFQEHLPPISDDDEDQVDTGDEEDILPPSPSSTPPGSTHTPTPDENEDKEEKNKRD